MKLDRSINPDGRGKYALIRLRAFDAMPLDVANRAHTCIGELERLGMIDWGEVGTPSEFFVIKLRDAYARLALLAYSYTVKGDPEYAEDVRELAERAGERSPHCKEPD